jgi:hypothetical protein
MAVAAAAAIGAAAASCVVAAAFAVYALLRPEIGPAGASAAVAAAFAALAVIIALVAVSGSRGGAKAVGERDPIALAERLLEMVRERPWAAGVGAVVLCLIALRSPAVMEAVARAFFDSRAPRKRRTKA